MGTLVVALLALELAARTVLVSASKDLRRFRAYPERAAALASSPAPRVAFVGNSATDEGVDLDVLVPGLTALGVKVSAGKFVADASRVDTWHFLLKDTFYDRGNSIDTAVITFYEDDLLDGNRIEIGRLAHFFTSVPDWPSVFTIDLRTFDERSEFVLSSLSAAIAVRGRLKERVLGALVPGYKAFLRDVNQANLLQQQAREAALPPQSTGAHDPGSHPLSPEDPAPGDERASLRKTRALARLLAVAREEGVKLVFVAYPVPAAFEGPPYPLYPEMTALLAASGARLVDARDPRALGLTPRHYADDVHLTPEGARVYSKALAEWLAPVLASP